MLVAVGAVGALCASPVRAAAVVGVWTTTEGSQIELVDCGQALCGKLVDSPALTIDPAATDTKNPDAALRGRALKGLLILSGFQGGPQKWHDGTIYDSKTGSSYSASLELVSDDVVELKACLVGPLCKTQKWTRKH